MDRRTLEAYDRCASAFATDWHEQPPPTDLHALARQFFRKANTADVGCGSGREVAWLNKNGYPATGYDPSDGLIGQARLRHPTLRFEQNALPALTGVGDGSFANVLCETVIMHMAPALIAPSIERLLAILAPGGTLYLSWRVTAGADQRDGHGRLYAAFDASVVTRTLAAATIVLDEERMSLSSGKVIHRIVARKRG